jgi:5-formyltetrahydrofolate cyclo-ligase
MLPLELTNLLGLARRARKIVVGHDAVQEALSRRQAALLILATDSSSSSSKHWAEKYSGVPQIRVGTKGEWGEFWDRKEVGVMAVTDQNFAREIAKKTLRRQQRQIRRALPREQRERASVLIQQKLLPLEIYQRARSIHVYASWQDEVDTHALLGVMLHEGRRVALPKIQPQSRTLAHYFIDDIAALTPGAYGILEPHEDRGAKPATALEVFDLVIVPGLAFDRRGHRLGYGVGYYDRFLLGISAPKVGFAFAAQIVNHVPAAPHDRRVDFIVTESEVIICDSTP